ncbi:MAG: site-2 protease family protein [Lachnospiraceae bacterium]|nr:site-2 protease family protein [Lachnospiraceae bacterium]
MSIILFLVIFLVVVVAHEFGHFIAARKNGIHVVEFFIGMGPTLFSFQKGDTKYSLKLLPIGGACMFEGEDGLEKEKGESSERAFPNAPVWARVATIFAGPLFNFILGYVMAVILVSVCGITTPQVLSLTEESRAAEAGIQTGDMITGINGKRIHLGGEVTLISQLNTKGETLTITYERNGQEGTAVVSPSYDEASGRYYMGLGIGGYLKCNVPQTFEYAFYTMKFYVESTFKSLGMLVSGQLSKDDVSGPVGLVKVVDEVYDSAKEYGALDVMLNMMEIALLLSVNLGIMNLLPFPALDGGRLVFLLVEAFRGKPIPPEKEGMVHLAGMMALMVLMVLVFFNDITKFFR